LKSLAKLEHFNYFIQRSTHIYHKYGITKGAIRRIKVKTPSSHIGLIGYKIQLRGRFTRKQIAAKHVFQGGHVPLNTLNGNIDYGFATVPIKNSAIGIKV
jgi:ribosomal protein S3